MTETSEIPSVLDVDNSYTEGREQYVLREGDLYMFDRVPPIPCDAGSYPGDEVKPTTGFTEFKLSTIVVGVLIGGFTMWLFGGGKKNGA